MIAAHSDEYIFQFIDGDKLQAIMSDERNVAMASEGFSSLYWST